MSETSQRHRLDLDVQAPVRTHLLSSMYMNEQVTRQVTMGMMRKHKLKTYTLIQTEPVRHVHATATCYVQ